LENSVSDPPSGGVLAAGFTGLAVGFLAGFFDAILSTKTGKEGWLALEIGQSLAVLVPLGCVGGILVCTGGNLLQRIYQPAQRVLSAIFPSLWCFAVFVYLAVYYYSGLSANHLAYIKCGLLAAIIGIPSYAGMFFLWRWLRKKPVSFMVLFGAVLGICIAIIEIFVARKELWNR
jgi:hypothetical protein